jgi:hypothetical protein
MGGFSFASVFFLFGWLFFFFFCSFGQVLIADLELKILLLLSPCVGITVRPRIRVFLFLGFFFFGWDWGLNSGLCSHKAGILLLEPHLQSIFALVVLEIGSQELVAWAGL